MHIQDPEERRWIAGAGRAALRPSPTREEQKHILGRLNAAEAFETFLQTKYVGQRRFSLEGARVVIPLLDEILQHVGRGRSWTRSSSAWPTAAGSTCWPTSSASRTRRSSPSSRATSTRSRATGSGDVKYHLGMTGKFTTPRRRARHDGLRWWPTRPTWRRSTRCSRASCGPSRTDRPQARGLHRAAAAGARRRRVRRPGRGRRDAQPVPAARLPHRRHRARGGQQPGRLHHRAGVLALVRSTPPTSPG